MEKFDFFSFMHQKVWRPKKTSNVKLFVILSALIGQMAEL